DVQAPPYHLQQLTRAQQKKRIAGLAVALIAYHEGFVDQHAAFVQAIDEQRQQGAMQVVGNDNAVKTLHVIGPGATFDICFTGADARNIGQGGQRSSIPVQGLDAITEAGKIARMPTLTTRKIQHSATCYDLPRKTLYPRGMTKLLMRIHRV